MTNQVEAEKLVQRPMTEDQLKAECQKMVKIYLCRLLGRIAKIVGLTSVVATIAVIYGIVNYSKDVAQDVAQKVVNEKTKEVFDDNQVIFDNLSNDLIKLYKNLGSLENEMKRSEKLISTLAESASSLGESEKAKLLEMIKELHQKPDVQQIIAQAEKNRKTVCGEVLASGSSIVDGNYRIEREAKGQYLITFSDKFTSVPSFICNPTATSQYNGKDKSHPADTTVNVMVTHGEVRVWTYGITSNGHGEPVDNGFSFICIGE